MNTFTKLFLRKPVFTVVLTLLLTLAVGFSCIGFSAYATAYEQRIMIEKDYTSIALPAPKRVLQYKTEDGAVMYYEDDTFAYDFDRIEAVVKKCDVVFFAEQAGVKTAHCARSDDSDFHVSNGPLLFMVEL